MARPLRIEFPGALYHVTSRGNEQKDVFRDDKDRAIFREPGGQVLFLDFLCLTGDGDRGQIRIPRRLQWLVRYA